MKDIYELIISGKKLPNIQTAQTVNAGSTGESRAQNYKNMLSNRKLGYMAALKNIKNILESGADEETVDMLCSLLTNEKACLNSKVLPFRYLDAKTVVQHMNIDRLLVKKLLKAIETGFILSARNIEMVQPGEKVALMLDESGSMGSRATNNLSAFDVGKTLMSSMLTGLDKGNCIGYLWGDSAREVSVDGSPFEFMDRTQRHGCGTNLGTAFRLLTESNTFVDKIVVFTDMQQNYLGLAEKVKAYRKINPNVKVLFWNLVGYGGGTPLKLSHDILEVAGYSDKILEVIPKMWKDKDALIKEIEAIQL